MDHKDKFISLYDDYVSEYVDDIYSGKKSITFHDDYEETDEFIFTYNGKWYCYKTDGKFGSDTLDPVFGNVDKLIFSYILHPCGRIEDLQFDKIMKGGMVYENLKCYYEYKIYIGHGRLFYIQENEGEKWERVDEESGLKIIMYLLSYGGSVLRKATPEEISLLC